MEGVVVIYTALRLALAGLHVRRAELEQQTGRWAPFDPKVSAELDTLYDLEQLIIGELLAVGAEAA